MTQLSVHFSLEELTTTQIRGADNTPPPAALERLRETAQHMETVRAFLDHPIVVTSGYRSPEVNRRVGGSKTSAHMEGWAVDFLCPRAGTPHDVCKLIAASNIAFDQLVNETHWTHISFAPTKRMALLTAHFGAGGTTYSSGIA